MGFLSAASLVISILHPCLWADRPLTLKFFLPYSRSKNQRHRIKGEITLSLGLLCFSALRCGNGKLILVPCLYKKCVHSNSASGAVGLTRRLRFWGAHPKVGPLPSSSFGRFRRRRFDALFTYIQDFWSETPHYRRCCLALTVRGDLTVACSQNCLFSAFQLPFFPSQPSIILSPPAVLLGQIRIEDILGT